jgi:CubicO group peptidase (beta-lactamase class C family)
MKQYLLSLLIVLLPTAMQAQDSATFDQLLQEAVQTDEPGAAVLVAQGDRVMYRAARGMSDLELGVVMAPEHVFRIGSITKQFTAVAILQLMEQGKLKLDDDITVHIPEYPTNGKRITVEMLLNHTSGIRSYTDMKEFDPLTQRRDVRPEEIMAFFMNEPPEFEPGTQWRYNNSGYVLLGIIIERITGRSYAEYVEEEFFAKLGMKRSSYGRDDVLIPGRAKGYGRGGDGFWNAGTISLTWPYAAGSLMSTVDDLHTWNRAVFGGKLLKAETLKRAHTEKVIPGFGPTRYGHGWMLGNVQGVASIEHGGGINGFVTHGLYLPAEDLYVAVLTNREADLAPNLAAKLAATAIGKPYTVTPIEVDAGVLAAYQGVYSDKDGNERYLRVQNGNLISQRKGGGTFTLIPIGRDRFAFEGSLTRMGFQRDRKGRVTGLTMQDRAFGDTEWKRTDKPLPEAPREEQMTEAQLKPLVGEYELAPGFILTVSHEGPQLYIQATGQPRFEAYATSTTEFFLKVVDARMVFHADGPGRAESLTWYQGGQEIPAPRVR